MAEDDAAPDHLISAIKRVDALPWPVARHKALTQALHLIAGMLHFQIVKVEPPVAPPGSDPTSTPAQEKNNGQE